MNTQAPPRVATWLLQKFVTGYCAESLAGDLLEEWRNGRSAAWYWRQVLHALLLSAWSNVRAHGLTFALAVLSYSITIWLSRFGTWSALRIAYKARLEVFGRLGSTPTALGIAKLTEAGTSFAWFALVFLAQGYIVERLHRRFTRTAVLVALAAFVWWPNVGAIGYFIYHLSDSPDAVTPMLIDRVVFLAQNIVFVMIGALWLARRWPPVTTAPACNP